MNSSSIQTDFETSFKSYIKSPEYLFLLLIAAFFAVIDIQVYASSDIHVHRQMFYLYASGSFQMTTEGGLNAYLPTYLMILAPIFAMCHSLSEPIGSFFIKFVELSFFIGNVTILGYYCTKRYWLLPLCYILIQFNFEYVANGGRFECMVLFFFLLTLLFHKKEKYFLAGMAIGMSCFKLYNLPVIFVLILYHIICKNKAPLVRGAAGFILVNIPTIIVLIMSKDGSNYLTTLTTNYKTHQSYFIKPDHLLYFIQPIWPDIADAYCRNGVWKWFLIPSIAIAVNLLVKKKLNLAEGMLIAFFPVAFLWQGEKKVAFYFILFFIAVIPYLNYWLPRVCLFVVSFALVAPVRIHNMTKTRLGEGFYSSTLDQITGYRVFDFSIYDILLLKYWLIFSFFLFFYFLYQQSKQEKCLQNSVDESTLTMKA